jgi:hypothetical protein
LSKLKETVDWEKFADAHELDDYLGPEELTELEVMTLERLSLSKELEELAERMQKSLDRVRYYGESIDADEFEFLHREVLRLRKNFG